MPSNQWLNLIGGEGGHKDSFVIRPKHINHNLPKQKVIKYVDVDWINSLLISNFKLSRSIPQKVSIDPLWNCASDVGVDGLRDVLH